MTTAYGTNRSAAALDTRRLIRTTLLAALLAALANTIVYYAGSALGAFPSDVIIQADMPMTLFPIVSLTVLATLAAGGVYGLLARLTKNPNRTYLLLAAVVLAVMAIPPFTIAGAPAAMIVALQITHLTVAGIATYALLRYASPR